MAAIPQKVLNWLHSVLVNEYSDVPRTYNDAVQALSQYQTLRPQTDVYTFENGRSCLLLHVKGTLPVPFRGTTYSFPISLWIPHEYPRECPIAFVTPTNEMLVRPGQHVGGEGKIYHPYLANWRLEDYRKTSALWHLSVPLKRGLNNVFLVRSNISDFLQNLQDVFSREPPVVSKYQQTVRLPPPGQTNGQPPSVPPVPPKPGRSTPGVRDATSPQSSAPDGPPPPPPKPFEARGRPQSSQTEGGPPLPPQPMRQATRDERFQGNRPNNHFLSSYGTQKMEQPARQNLHPLRHDQYPQDQITRQPTGYESPNPHGINNISRPGTYNQSQDYQGPPLPGGVQRHGSSSSQPVHRQYPTNDAYPYQKYQQQPHQTPISRQQQRQQQTPAPKPPEDLLSSPFDTPLPLNHQPLDIPAPPIPSNPEKEALLSAISQALTQQLYTTLASHAAALPPLRAQRTALEFTLRNMQQEHQALTSLQSLLSSNEAILHTAMRDADDCIENAKHRTVPPVDEVLVAPTVVGEQLYNLVAEERACEEARGVLGRALDKDRIGVDAWVKNVRGLAREEFLKKVLIKKCARGLGLREERWA